LHVTGEAEEACLNTIQREVTRLIALSEDLYVRVRLAGGDVALQATAVDLGQSLREAAVTLEEQHPGRIIALMLEEPLPVVKADKGILDTVLWLMLNHALRYSNEPEVTVEARPCGESELELVLTDDAPSLSPDYAEMIFEALPDLPPPMGRPRLGLGLGLHVTRELVRRMGGDLRIEPRPQAVGNCFVLRLSTVIDECPNDVSSEG
jgi:signal transduction histidine kinase